MDEEYIKCPKCGHANTVDFWDSNTKDAEGISEDQYYLSAGEPIEKHRELQTYYRCPMCNREIKGVDLIRG